MDSGASEMGNHQGASGGWCGISTLLMSQPSCLSYLNRKTFCSPSSCPTSQITQPHDLKFFPDMKRETKKNFDYWAVFYALNNKLAIEDFPYVVQRAYDKAATPRN